MNGYPPLYCPRCGELFTATAPEEGDAAVCPACGSDVTPPVGRFAGIVNVVSFVARLLPGRRQALQAALHPGEPPRDEAPTSADLAWINNWLSHHEITASLYWRRCLVLAAHLLPTTPEPIDQQQVFAVARDIAQQAGGNQSFAPRRY
jgi:hypothetical protein